MRILSAKINVKKNIIIFMNDMCEEYEFNMDECKALPKWAEEELGKMHFLSQCGCWMFYIR